MTVIEIFETFNADDRALDDALEHVDGIVVAGDAAPEQARRFAYRVWGMGEHPSTWVEDRNGRSELLIPR